MQLILSTLKMEAVYSFETYVLIYKSTWCKYSEQLLLKLQSNLVYPLFHDVTQFIQK
jgi:hypothetical protein